MKGKIGLEEHFAIDDTLMDSRAFFPDDIWREVRERILDLHGRRLRLMDEFGMQMMVLSLNAPAIQAIPDAKKANEIARKANDYLAEQVKKRPDRFQALAALPLQDPDLATREIAALREGARHGRRAGQRLSRRSAIRTRSPISTRSNTGRSGRWSSSSTCRSICIRAIRCRRTRASTRRRMAAGPDLGVRPRDRGARAAPDGLGPVRQASQARHHPRPHGRGPAVNAAASGASTTPTPGFRIGTTTPRKRRSRTISRPTSTSRCRATSARAIAAHRDHGVNGADRIMFSTDWPFENIDHAAVWFDAVTTSARRTASRSAAPTL